MTTIDKVVAAFSSADVGWTEAGASPYLDIVDAPTNIISTFSDGVREGSFTFVAFNEALWAAITSVKLYVVMRSQDIDTNFVAADPTHGANLVHTNANINVYETIVDDSNTELLGRFVSVADLNTFGVTYIKTGSLTIAIDQAFLPYPASHYVTLQAAGNALYCDVTVAVNVKICVVYTDADAA